MEIKLRAYQQEALDAIFAYFYAKKGGNPLCVAPTGSGKSIILSGFCNHVLSHWPEQKILVISHVKEILEQNYTAIAEHCPKTQISFYSAGLKEKKLSQITIAGIQSIYKKTNLFQEFDIILIDECHAIPHAGMGRYRQFLLDIDRPVIGFTATPFRTGGGYLHIGDGALFDEIVYTIQIGKLIKQRFLCPLTSKAPVQKMNSDKLKIRMGDYILKELSACFDTETLTKQIIQELLQYEQLRKKWLIFAIDIKHAEHIAQQLNECGIKTCCVHSKMKKDRAQIIQDFKTGAYQALVNVSVLTTGFDCPEIDLIALLRPTASPVLHVQTIGRGLRIAEGKEDCLVLDFAGNLMRNGPINNPVVTVATKTGAGEAIMKECPNCAELVPAAVRTCPACNHTFVFQSKLTAQAASSSVVYFQPEWHKVTEISYVSHSTRKGQKTLKVIYKCGLRTFAEHICVEHFGYPRYKAVHWWTRRKGKELPKTVNEALQKTYQLMTPYKLLIDESQKYPRILNQEFI